MLLCVRPTTYSAGYALAEPGRIVKFGEVRATDSFDWEYRIDFVCDGLSSIIQGLDPSHALFCAASRGRNDRDYYKLGRAVGECRRLIIDEIGQDHVGLITDNDLAGGRFCTTQKRKSEACDVAGYEPSADRHGNVSYAICLALWAIERGIVEG